VSDAAAATEHAVLFECEGEQLVGVLSLPDAVRSRGVLVVVGGPQYRAGSHRQFTLLARRLAAAGFPCMRFDYRGMGDSTGAARSFEEVRPDLHRAIETFVARASGLKEVVLWGLCDAASAALMFGVRHPLVRGVVLLNPWVRSEATFSQARIRHYYTERLLSGDLWTKVLRGRIEWRGSLASLLDTMRTALRRGPKACTEHVDNAAAQPFQAKMAAGVSDFDRPALLVISGRDLTAREFLDHAAHEPRWRAAMARPHFSRVDLPDADHTFSEQHWQAEVERTTLAWLESW
jgi:exosortase A-associated hydrolase 1